MAEVDEILERVAFLSVSNVRGSHSAVGHVTGLFYTITANPTPVSRYDLEDLLMETAPPCCGHRLPFDGEVRVFGIAIPTERQVLATPRHIIEAEPVFEPMPRPEKRQRKRVNIPVPDEVVESFFRDDAGEAEPEEPEKQEDENLGGIENGNLSVA